MDQVFLARVSNEMREHLHDIAIEMTGLFGITRAEAVARINAAWPDQDFLEASNMLLHEDEHYWALFVYYGGDVPDWRRGADRSSWRPAALPAPDSGCWTVRDGSAG